MAVASPRRNRYDSGFEDEMNCCNEDPTALLWHDTVSDWSFKTHSIITQEVVRMKAMTRAKQEQLNSANSKAERDVIANRWREEMTDMMEVTYDLIQCVSNDVVEMHSGDSSSSTSDSMTSHDLGKIIEDELGERKEEDKRVLIVRTKKSSKKRKRSRRNSSKWESKNSFTIRVDELQKRGESKTGQWKKDSDSPVVWEEGSNDSSLTLEPEDIYRDWVRMMRRSSFADDDNDINDVFWSISFGGGRIRRERRISEVLENLPFQDQPDIFEDRCDLLDAIPPPQRANSKVKKPKRGRNIVNGRKRQPKSYWNIFDEWKKIFREPKGDKRRQRKRPMKTRRRKRPNRRRTPLEPEDFFRDFRSNFNEKPQKDLNQQLCDRGRRRSRELVEDECGDNENVAKRQRVGGNAWGCKKNWEVIRMESSKTFDLITKNIEQKIREAFQEVKREDEVKQVSNNNSPSKKMMDESRREFIRLREQVRQVRQERMRITLDSAKIFEQWRWNLKIEEDKAKPIEVKSKANSVVKPYPNKLQMAKLQSLWNNPCRISMSPNPKTLSEAKMRQRRIAVKSYAVQPRRRGAVKA